MSEIHRVLESFPPKNIKNNIDTSDVETDLNIPTFSEIPDLFFDQILVDYKLNLNSHSQHYV